MIKTPSKLIKEACVSRCWFFGGIILAIRPDMVRTRRESGKEEQAGTTLGGTAYLWDLEGKDLRGKRIVPQRTQYERCERPYHYTNATQ